MFLKLSRLLEKVNHLLLQGDESIEIDNIMYDTRKPQDNSVFLCIEGKKVDGRDYALQAISLGARAIVTSEKRLKIPKPITVIWTPDVRKALARMSQSYFNYPSKKLITVGVTGSKGKTTTTFFIRRILEGNGIKTGIIGTVKIDTGDEIAESENTTPESFLIHKYFNKMILAGCKAVVMEVSSQALMMSRTEGIDFDIGVFTNLTADHLGENEHKDFIEYYNWKKKLFCQCKIGIINGDDIYGQEIGHEGLCQTEYYGFDKKEYVIAASNYRPIKVEGLLGFEFSLRKDATKAVTLPFAGKFNVYNIIAALQTATHFGISIDNGLKALENFKVPGRQEAIPGINESTVIVDYAHNGQSLKSILISLREYNPGRIICVFGCGGERSRDRRLEMGEISSNLADFSIITSDNPRNEPPFSIINDIIVGVKKGKGNYRIVANREDAIYQAVQMGKKNDIILIAGKGHETYQIIGNERKGFDDRKVILESLEKVKHGQNYSKRNIKGN